MLLRSLVSWSSSLWLAGNNLSWVGASLSLKMVSQERMNKHTHTVYNHKMMSFFLPSMVQHCSLSLLWWDFLLFVRCHFRKKDLFSMLFSSSSSVCLLSQRMSKQEERKVEKLSEEIGKKQSRESMMKKEKRVRRVRSSVGWEVISL